MELSLEKKSARRVLHHQFVLSWQLNYTVLPIIFFFLTVALIIPGTWSGFQCMENPCMHGICIDYLRMNSSYDCYCRNGFTGYSCQINWDECRSNPCLNGGSCVDGIASFNCSCPENYGGTFCEVDLTDCEESLHCQNNGTCIGDSKSANGTGFMCACPPGFTGDQCEIDISVCNSTESVCQNGGKCVDGPGNRFHCECEPGWSGESCQIDIDECESNPCMAGGICVNKINDFSCACPFGFTGRTCETKLRICEENPCMNKAFCLHESEDDESQKTCYCVPDFHGTLCELRYNDCEPPPKCFNGGSCIDGVGAFTCSCPPGFFGPTCKCTSYNETDPECSQYQSNDTILSSETVTAATSFYSTPTKESEAMLSSPSFLATPTVQLIPSSDMGSLPLPSEMYSKDKGATDYKTPIPHSSVFDSSGGTGRDDLDTRMLSETAEIPLPTKMVLTDIILSPFPTKTLVMASVSDILQPSPGVPGDTVAIYEFSKYVSLEGSEEISHPSPSILPPLPSVHDSLSVQITPTMMASPGISVEVTSIATPDLESVISLTELHPGGDGSIPTVDLTADFVTTPTASDFEQGEQTEPLLPSPTIVETASLPKQSDMHVSEISKDSSIPFKSDLDLVITPTASIPFSYPSSSPSPLDSSYPDSVDYLSSIVPPPSAGIETSHGLVTPTSDLVPPEATASIIDGVLIPPPISTPTSGLASVSVAITPAIPAPVSSDALEPPSSEGDYSSASVTIPAVTSQLPFPVSTSPSPLSPTTGEIPTSTEFTASTPSPTSPFPNQTDPCFNYCYNNARCISKTIEPICVCPLRFMGNRCEIPREKFLTASFTGSSYLSYRVPNDSSISKVHVKSKLVTIVPEGILLYTGAGRMYALIFIQSGHVTLHFSCGSQSMHFVETRTRVDNGFNFTLDFRMEMIIQGVNLYRCSAEVSVNQSYVMKGEQIVGKEGVTFPAERPIEKVYLGGVPALNTDAIRNDDLVGILPGFRGCLHNLMINQEQKDIYDDALDGKEVDECRSFSCVANPCHGSAPCLTTNSYPFWECRCPPGFQGHRCQLIVCTTNPCQNGATCTYSEDSLNHFQNANLTDAEPDPYRATVSSTAVSLRDQLKPICLCPLGFTGAVCQQRINITKPAFFPVSGYASFISYDQIPRFSDWFQLKFHFVTKNISQISILLYTGNDRGVRPIKSLLRSQIRLNSSNNSYSLSATSSSSSSSSSHQPFSSGFADFHPDPISDFFSITFLQGFIALTWNLGSGTQRITTPSRIDNRLNIHTLFAGRSGRLAWLKVDGMRNVTGKSPGPLYRLNSNPNELYIGGYKTYKFEGLSHDLPLHQGFQGCIFDLGFRVKNRLYLPKAVSGRNVKNCFEEVC